MKNRSISDKNLGYLVFSFTVVLIIAATIAMIMQSKHTVHRITVTFDLIGTLQPQDRIVEKGVPIGQVYSVAYRDHKAYVIIDFDHPIKIRKGSTIQNRNYSLMGDRMLFLQRSKTGDFANEDYIWEGKFESGIAEALHLMDGVLGKVLNLQQQLVSFIDGDTLSPSLSKRFHTLLTATENTLKLLNTQVDKYRQPMQDIITNANKISIQATTLTTTSQQWLNSQVSNTDTLLNQVQEIQKYSQEGISVLHSQLNHLESSAFVLNHLEKKDLLNNLNKVSNGLYKLTQYFLHKVGGLKDEDGNKVGVIRFRNVHLLGKNAREKRKERANLP